MVFRSNQRSRTTLSYLGPRKWISAQCCVDPLRPPALSGVSPSFPASRPSPSFTASSCLTRADPYTAGAKRLEGSHTMHHGRTTLTLRGHPTRSATLFEHSGPLRARIPWPWKIQSLELRFGSCNSNFSRVGGIGCHHTRAHVEGQSFLQEMSRAQCAPTCSAFVRRRLYLVRLRLRYPIFSTFVKFTPTVFV
jgi:hypothetical protein